MNRRSLWMGLLLAFVLPRWTVGEESDVSARVKRIVARQLHVDPSKVTDSASFIDDLGANSLDTVNLVTALEVEFGCEIPDDAAETMITVGDAIMFLKTCPKEQSRRSDASSKTRKKSIKKNGKNPCNADIPPAYCKTRGNR